MLKQNISHLAGSFSAQIRDPAKAQPAVCLNTEKWQRGCGVETAFHSSALQLGLLTSEIILLKYMNSRNSHSNLKLLYHWFLILLPNFICCFDLSNFQLTLATSTINVFSCRKLRRSSLMYQWLMRTTVLFFPFPSIILSTRASAETKETSEKETSEKPKRIYPPDLWMCCQQFLTAYGENLKRLKVSSYISALL